MAQILIRQSAIYIDGVLPTHKDRGEIICHLDERLPDHRTHDVPEHVAEPTLGASSAREKLVQVPSTCRKSDRKTAF